MRLKIPSHNGLLDSLRSHSTLHAHAHERSLKLTCRTGGRWLTPHETSERSTSVMMLNTTFNSMVMSSVACACALARSRPRWPSSRPCQCSVPQPSWPSPVRLAINFSHGARSERRQLCGPDSGISSQLYATHARFWKSHFVPFLRSRRHPDSHAGALQKGSKTEHLEIESRQSGYVG